MRRVALIGFGGVGQAFAEILDQRREDLLKSGLETKLVAISDPVKGSVYDPEGLVISEALSAVHGGGSLAAYPDHPGLQRGWDSLKTIRESVADTIIEVSPTMPGGQPAIDHCRAAFAAGKDVITSNKGPALRYRDLVAEAEAKGAQFGIEGTVMSGTPALRMPQHALAGNRISAVRGILNGTTNYMLTRMEDGLDYEAALVEAQKNGFAEADPTGDVEGYDALYKIVILSAVVLGRPLSPEAVARQGISGLKAEDIERAKAEGRRWKLVAEAQVEPSGSVTASVAPVMLPLTDPLSGVGGALNAITYQCDLLGPVTLIGAGAGRMETGFALLSDLIDFQRKEERS